MPKSMQGLNPQGSLAYSLNHDERAVKQLGTLVQPSHSGAESWARTGMAPMLGFADAYL